MGRPQPILLDRDDELAALRTALERSAAGQGTTVLLEGAAGMGKSALTARTREMARAAGARVLSARGGELEHDYAFGIVRQLFEPLLTAADAPTHARLLAGSAAPAARILGLSEGESGVYAAGFPAMRAIYWLTAQLALEGPLLLAVDDLHWADVSSLRALDYVARRAGELPVMLLVAFRAEEPGAPNELLDQIRATPGAVRCSLRALAPAAVARMVRARIPQASEATCLACHTATAGNPLYLEELLRAIDGNPAAAGGGVDDVLHASVPSLAERVLRRAETVAAAAPTLARSMAVLGDGGRLADAAVLSSVPEAEAGRIAHELRRIELLGSEDPFAFVHPLIRRSVYDSLPEVDRQSTHRRAARLLAERGAPAEAVASHLRVLPPDGSPQVAAALLAAAEQALDQAAPDEAVGWLERALTEAAAEPPRVHLLARLGLAKMIQRDPAAISHLREAHALADEPGLRSLMAATLAEMLTHAGRWDEAIALIGEAEVELSDADAELQVEIAALRAAVTLFDPRRIDDFEQRRDLYDELSLGPYWASRAIAALLSVAASHRGRCEEALMFADRALNDGRLLNERGTGAWTAPHVLGALVETERFDLALAAIDQVDAAARASGAVLGEFTAVAYRGWVHARLGDLAAAAAELTSVLDFAHDSGLLMGVTTVAFLLLDTLIEREGLDHVSDLIEGTQLPPDFLSTASGAMLLEVRGSLRLLRRERGLAIEDLRAAGEINSNLRFGPAYSSWRSSLALALPATARDEALKLAHEELALAEDTGLSRPMGIALRTVGILDGPERGLDWLGRSVAVLENSPLALEHARSLVALGGALRRLNQRAAARPPLTQGLELAHACGAGRLTETARLELRAAGGRQPQAINRDGSLTPSEARVVNLAASGATNVEIAQQLYITLKTVETHLYRAYAKLGLSGSGSRARLSDTLAQAEHRAPSG